MAPNLVVGPSIYVDQCTQFLKADKISDMAETTETMNQDPEIEGDETTDDSIAFSINGQYIHANGKVVGIFVSEDVSNRFVAALGSLKTSIDAYLAVGNVLAEMAGDCPEAKAWRSIADQS